MLPGPGRYHNLLLNEHLISEQILSLMLPNFCQIRPIHGNRIMQAKQIISIMEKVKLKFRRDKIELNKKSYFEG